MPGLDAISLGAVTIYHGPNPYGSSPVLTAPLQLAPALESRAQALCEALHKLYPGWLKVLPMGLAPARLVGECAVGWAMGALNEVRGFLWEAGAIETPGGATLWLAFHRPDLSQTALVLALRALLYLDAGHRNVPALLQPHLDALWLQCRKIHPDYQVRVLMEAARADKLPLVPGVGGGRAVQFGWGRRGRLYFESASNEDGLVGGRIAASKLAGKAAFAALGAPVPRHLLVGESADLERAAQMLGWPCVTKPLDRGGGKGVSAGIGSLEELRAGFAYARQYTQGPVMVEAYVPGSDYRLMVVRGRLIAAIRRQPSMVTGDGSSSVQELLAVINQGRSSNMVSSRYLRPIVQDAVLVQHLARQGLGMDSVLPLGQRATLRSNANLSTGGQCCDVTGAVHPHVVRMAEGLAQSMGLASTGLDYITTDISRSWQDVGGAFIEMNTTPGLDVLIAAGCDPVWVGRQVLGPEPGRIPVALAVVDEPALPALQAWWAGQTLPEDLGWVCGDAAGVGSLVLSLEMQPSWGRVAGVLGHRGVGHSLLILGGHEIQRWGMPVDHADQILLTPDAVPERWRSVLEAHCSQWVAVGTLAELFSRLAACWEAPR